MKIKQLGNGGGLDYMQTNSSFLIENDGKYILIDCGFNIMERLQREEDTDDNFKISKITDVFITHNHADHVGNLETLIFYSFFKLGNILSIHVPDEMKNINGINKTLVGGSMQRTTICEVLITSCYTPYKTNSMKVAATPVYHCDDSAYGFIITSKGNCVFISGDTKANANIEERVLDRMQKETVDPDKTLFFHDFSNWNAPSRNVHACESDFEIEYSKEFKDKIIKYHHGGEFNKEWQILSQL